MRKNIILIFLACFWVISSSAQSGNKNMDKALKYRDKKDWANAIKFAKKGVAEQPNNPMFKYFLGTCQFYNKSFDNALQTLSKINTTGMSNGQYKNFIPYIKLSLANSYLLTGNYDKAMEMYHANSDIWFNLEGKNWYDVILEDLKDLKGLNTQMVLIDKAIKEIEEKLEAERVVLEKEIKKIDVRNFNGIYKSTNNPNIDFIEIKSFGGDFDFNTIYTPTSTEGYGTPKMMWIYKNSEIETYEYHKVNPIDNNSMHLKAEGRTNHIKLTKLDNGNIVYEETHNFHSSVRRQDVLVLVENTTTDMFSEISDGYELVKGENMFYNFANAFRNSENAKYLAYHTQSVLPEIKELKNLEYLGIALTSHSNLPEEIWQLSNLKHLVIILHFGAPTFSPYGRGTFYKTVNFKLSQNIARLSKLKSLTIYSGATAKIILPNTIGQLKNLERLKVISPKCDFVNIPSSIGNLINLRELYLHLLPAGLPESIGNLSRLNTLVIHQGRSKGVYREGKEYRGKVLDKLPESIGNLKNLRHLKLKELGYLTSLPQSIGNLENLQSFKIISSTFKYLPESIGNLKNLKELEIYNNMGVFSSSQYGLVQLPRSIGNLSSLVKLSVNYTLLQTVPSELGKLKSLKTLLLYRNKITSLPSGLSGMTNLESLNISGKFHSLQSLPDDFYKLKNLKWLYIPRNTNNQLVQRLNLYYDPDKTTIKYVTEDY